LSIGDSDWHNIWITVLSMLIGALILYAIKSWHTLMRRMDAQDAALAKSAAASITQAQAAQVQAAAASRNEEAIANLRGTVAKEFGGNSGGMRQRIDEIDKKVDVLSRDHKTLSSNVSDLAGRFTQHLVDLTDAATKKRGTK
jgi:hypothetical protein